MKAKILLQNVFVLCLFTTAGGPLVLHAQRNPPLSRFNVKLGTIRTPTAPAEIPVVTSGFWLREPGFSFTADGTEIFLSNAAGDDHNLYVATRTNPGDPWGALQPVGAPVNSTFYEYLPTISADGLILMWSDGFSWRSSPRPGGQGASDLWMSTRADRTTPWSEPANLGPEVNSAAHEAFPHLTADILELYFIREEAVPTIYVSRRASQSAPWETATPLPSYLGSSYGQWFALPSPDGLTLMTATLVSGDPSWAMDILVSTRKDRNSPWGLPVSIGTAVNSRWNQVLPGVFAPDGSALYFLHDDGNGFIGNGSRVKRVELLPMLEITLGYSSLFSQGRYSHHLPLVEHGRRCSNPWNSRTARTAWSCRPKTARSSSGWSSHEFTRTQAAVTTAIQAHSL
jgi:hypothetical protein